MDQQNNRHSTLGRWGMRLLWLCLSIIVLGLILRLSLKTAFVQDRVREAIVSTANGQLNAQLSIEKLSGDLWKDITLSQISLSREDTIASVDSVHISYNIWALLGGKIDVADLEIYQPTLHAIQDAEGWNIERLAVESSDTTESSLMAFRIQNFMLDNGTVSVTSDSLPMGSSYRIRQMNIASSIGYDGSAFEVNLRDFSLKITEADLEQSLNVEAMASAKEQRVTLEKLVVATGKSIVEANGYANMADTSLQLGIASTPIYWSDITGIMEEYPIRENLDLTFSVEGSPEQFNLGLFIDGEGLQSFEMRSRVVWQSDVVVEQLTTTAESINLASLLADSTYPRFKNLDAAFDGRLNIADLTNASGELSFSASQIESDPYKLQKLSGRGSVKNQSLAFTVEAVEDQQSMMAELSARDIWSEQPYVKGRVRGKKVNPGHWLQDTTYQGNLTFDLSFEGTDWYPQKELWKYNGRMQQGTLLGHTITNAKVKGRVGSNEVSIDGGMNFHNGRIDMVVSLDDITTMPSYEYQLKTEGLDLGVLLAEQNFSTSINGLFKGKGTGFDPATMQLRSTLEVNSSVINGENVDTIFGDFSIQDSVVTVDSARIKSGIADGGGSVRLNMLDRYNANNELLLNLQLKDLTSLASLANANELQAVGDISGTLSPAQNEGLRFLGRLDVNEVVYDSLFLADRAQGSVDINFGERLLYLADLNLQEPVFSGVRLQNLSLKARGNYFEDSAEGQYDFQVSSSTEGRIEQSGTYQVATDSIRINTDELNFISDYRMLTLEESFELQYQNEILRMDTLRISSGDGSFLEIGLPIVSADEQRGFVKGNALNTAVIQSSLLGETYFQGMLSGEFNIDRRDTDLSAKGKMLLSDINFEGASFDSLLISTDIADERMQGTVSLKDQGDELISGETNLPFKLGDPETFEEDFFKEPVSGDLRVSDISIKRFQSYFEGIENTETSGLISFWGTLDGTAENPEFDADMILKNAVLSGVAIDSITAGANYRHIDEELTLDASVMSLKQQAAQISARLPLFIDMKTFQVDLPQQKDHIAVNIETDEFNLRALNDFIDPLLAREVRGRLNGSVQVKGAMEDLKTDGYLELKQGKVRLVPAGITVENITTTANFAPNQIKLSSFSAKSGNGNIKASGTLALEKLIPGNIDLKVTAQNFRAANTAEYNAVVNLNARTQGTVTSPKVTGSLDFLSGFIKLDNFGEKSVESVRLDAEDGEDSSISVYDSLALDVDVGFNRRFFIQNERYLEMEIELDGMLDLMKKSGGDLELFGDMSASNGYARPFGKRFDLEEGVVTFSGNPENPQLRIRTKYEPPQTQENIVIWYIIEGTVEDPKFRYESQPPMELENIISYTLFGQPFYALDSWKQVVASSGSNTTAADVALDVLLDRVEALATQQLGIDVVRIDNTHSGGETGTSVMTGWYLNPKVFFAIQNVITGSTPETGFLLEYMLRKDLKLILRQGNNIRQGVDLKWNYDY
ncbi:translocation/assembly module TamB domain-containing protein [Fodinibius sp. SL11]|uniref:translocation/assembly module TamB domain-containing protein n=1 Tax=Fodinibius sp. SL11 TaxID=3425690 RepID=UPI003F8848E3